MKEIRVGSTMVTFLVMDGRCQDEYLHCTSPGLAVRELVYLGLLVALFCGLLIGIARLAFCRTGFGVLLSFSGDSALWVLIAGFGGFGRVGSNPGYARAGQEVLVGFFLGFFGFGNWLPCMLA